MESPGNKTLLIGEWMVLLLECKWGKNNVIFIMDSDNQLWDIH